MLDRYLFDVILDHPVGVSMALGSVLVAGLFAFTRLPLDLAPQVEYPALTIRASWPGASPETIEMAITAPIEEIAGTLKGVHKIFSTSNEGESSVSVEFDPATRMDFARLQLNELLAAFNETRPSGAQPPVIERHIPEDLQKFQGFISYSLVGPHSPRELRRLAEELVVPRMMAVRGVGRVNVYGGVTRQIIIVVDPQKATALGVDPATLQRTLDGISCDGTVGALSSREERAVVAVQTVNRTLGSIGDLSVALTSAGTLIRLKDIALISDASPEPSSFYRINGMPSVTVVIDKEQAVNMLTVADEVFERVAEVARGLPDSCSLVKQSDQSRQLRNELHQLLRDSIFSVACLWAILVLFLGNPHTPLLLISSILFSIAGTFIVFRLLGVSLNLLTMGGLVLGFGRLVDDSIVVLDSIQRNAVTCDRRSAVVTAVRQIALPVLASTITTVGALVPIAFLSPDLRLMFGGFAAAVSSSLLFSLVISFSLIPLAMSRTEFSWTMPRVLLTVGNTGVTAYHWLLKKGLRHRKLVVFLIIWFFGLPLWLLPSTMESDSWGAKAYNATFGSDLYATARPVVNHLFGGASHLFFTKVRKGEIWEYGKETFLTVGISFPPGTEIEHYDAVARTVEREIQSGEFGVTKMTTRVMPDEAMIRADFGDSAATTVLPYLLKRRLATLATKTGGAAVGVRGFGPVFSTGFGGGGASFLVKVFGYNYTKVRGIAEDFRSRLLRNPRVAKVDIDGSFSRWQKSYELAVIVDRSAIARAGLTVAELVRAVRSHTAGEVGHDLIGIENTRVPCVIRLAGYREFSVRDLEAATVPDPQGNLIRIGTLVRFEERQMPSEIRREDQEYVRFISFDYDGPHIHGRLVLEKTLKNTPLPAGYRFDSEVNWFLLTEDTKNSLLLIALAAVIIVFMVTASLYESFVTPLIVILAIPFSFFGLFLAFYITDTTFGRGGYASVILLIGIVVTNSIVLVDHISKRGKKEGMTKEVLICAASDRIRPVMMTTLTTVAGLLPLLIAGEKTSVWFSLSLGTIGGLSSSMILTLVVIPLVMYRGRVDDEGKT